MLGNFTYCNPTKLYFGRGAVESLKESFRNTGITFCWYMAAVPSGKTEYTTRWLQCSEKRVKK